MSSTQTGSRVEGVIQAGDWEVFVRYTSGPSKATNAPYTIYGSSTSTVRVNQQTGGGTWYSLGIHSFDAGGTIIELTDDANGNVIADAIKLVPTGSDPLANAAFILIRLRCVNMAIANLGSIYHCLHDIFIADKPGSKTQFRNLYPIR